MHKKKTIEVSASDLNKVVTAIVWEKDICTEALDSLILDIIEFQKKEIEKN